MRHHIHTQVEAREAFLDDAGADVQTLSHISENSGWAELADDDVRKRVLQQHVAAEARRKRQLQKV